jgi:hypoxia up-regulated 1
MNVNSDEAAVLGAALHGATLSRQFRTKNIKLSDLGPYDVQVSYLAEAKSTDVSDAPPRTITSLAFAKGSRTGTRKTLTFRRKNDFSLSFSYKSPPASEIPVELLDARISGIAEALANITEAGGVDPVIKATILFSESGFVSVPEAVAYAEMKDDSLAGVYTPSCPSGCQGVADYPCREAQGLVWRWLCCGGWGNVNRRFDRLVFCTQND